MGVSLAILGFLGVFIGVILLIASLFRKTSFERGMFININQETLKKIQWDNFNFENIPDVANLYDWRASVTKNN